MPDLSAFHRNAADLLRHLGFDAPPADGRDLISLTVEQRFQLHLGAIDHDSWFMLAELGSPPASPEAALRALDGNRLAASPWQPVAALDDDGRLCCWLRLPGSGCDLPQLATAFDALIARAEALLDDTPAAP
ncbi:CesT family type III secretion system chaperone [Chromobacterium sp. CV08]|uniref:CesT family type III secretion system chaperone n=1 Tax=Chromobacterium sp. CV08 TaxID=3133274 RepID=UPI003DA93300